MINLAKTKPMKRIIITCIVLLLLLTSCSREQSQTPSSPTPQTVAPDMRVGFVVSSQDKDKDSAGRQRVTELVGADDVFLEVTDGNAVESAIAQMVSQGCKVIFSLSEVNKATIQSVAPNYPDVQFCQFRGDAVLENVASYDVRLYQGRYLTGIAAGGTTQSKMIGYVAPEANSEVIRGINGFALGVKMTNPNAKVHVAWGAGYGAVSEAVAAAQKLIEKGCDVIVCHESMQEVLSLIRSNNCYVVTEPNDEQQKDMDTFLTAPIYDYASYYESVIQTVGEGESVPSEFWGGAGENTVKMPLIGSAMSVDSQTKVQEQYDALAHGTMDVFEGPIYNQYELLTVPEGVTLEGEDLKYMLWFVDNVAGEIPQG